MLAKFAVTSTQGPSAAVVVVGAAAVVDGTVAVPGLVVPAVAAVSVVCVASVVSVVVPGDVSRPSGWESPPHAAMDRPSTTTIGSDDVLHRPSLTSRIVEENEVCLRGSSLAKEG